MENLLLLTECLEYIENNLTNPIKTEDIADAVYCSKSKIEKLFKVQNITVRDYIIRRRMSLAAAELSSNPDATLLDLAVKYGYGSNEAFTRAFIGVWHISPSDYRKNPDKFVLFPSMNFKLEISEDEYMSERRKFDISELYDLLQERRNCYFVGADIKSLVPINEIAHEAGDLAIINSLRRLEEACGDDDVAFRIGGDEFVILTNSADIGYAESLMKKIEAHNGETFDYNGREIPLGLHVGCFKSDSKNIRYSELFTDIHTKINGAKTEN